jgi:hypothetical protein
MVGHVTWQGRPSQPNPLQQLPITLTLKLGTTETDYEPTTTDASGFFTVPVGSLAPGIYSWRVKGPQYLANGGIVTLSGVPVTSAEMGLMRAGDCNNDNVVDMSDFLIVRSSYGRAEGGPNYDGRADLTGDGIVNMLDFALLSHNFNQGGAPPVSPRRQPLPTGQPSTERGAAGSRYVGGP